MGHDERRDRIATDQPPCSRRWIPLSLRVALAILTTFSIGAVWIGIPTYRQHLTANEIERGGGEVVIDCGGPAWLRQGIDRFRRWPHLRLLFGDVVEVAIPSNLIK